MKKYPDITREQFKLIVDWDNSRPIQMLNLLKFKTKIEGSEITGAAQYKKYMKAAMPFFQMVKAKVLYYGSPILSIIGPIESEWDKVLIVEYANKSDFLNMITAEAYPAHLRAAAIEDSRLILCTSEN